MCIMHNQLATSYTVATRHLPHPQLFWRKFCAKNTFNFETLTVFKTYNNADDQMTTTSNPTKDSLPLDISRNIFSRLPFFSLSLSYCKRTCLNSKTTCSSSSTDLLVVHHTTNFFFPLTILVVLATMMNIGKI
jgi:hypothetical protein